MRAAERFQFPLSAGDAVGVVATGFAVRPAAVRAGIDRLERMGFHVVAGPRLHSRDGYFAGTDRHRAAELNRCLRDPRLRAIWFARGGFGTARILPHVDWDALAEQSKLEPSRPPTDTCSTWAAEMPSRSAPFARTSSRRTPATEWSTCRLSTDFMRAAA